MSIPDDERAPPRDPDDFPDNPDDFPDPDNPPASGETNIYVLKGATFVDPLAVTLPTSVYLAFQEKLHPHVALGDALRQSTANLISVRREFVRRRIKIFRDRSTALLDII
jgi:hypothetical protein